MPVPLAATPVTTDAVPLEVTPVTTDVVPLAATLVTTSTVPSVFTPLTYVNSLEVGTLPAFHPVILEAVKSLVVKDGNVPGSVIL